MSSQSKNAHWQRPDSSAALPTAERPTAAQLVDPEDDLPSDTYAGDFETTLIPHYDPADSGSVRSSSSGAGVMGGHEPLPYQPQPTGRHSVFAPDGMDEHEYVDDERVRAASRRGTQPLGLLILRVGLGAVFLHLAAELNFHRLFNEAIERFSMERVGKRQAAALAKAGL